MASIRGWAPLRALLRRRNLKSFSSLVRGRKPEVAPVSVSRTGENLRSAISSACRLGDAALISFSLGFVPVMSQSQVESLARMLDERGVMDQFMIWMKSKRWADVKQLFELWIRSDDGNIRKPDVHLYNSYLSANLMMGACVEKMMDLVVKMDEFGICPNTISFNILLEAMKLAKETAAALNLFERMIQIGSQHKGSSPDLKSYELVISMLLSENRIKDVLKYIDGLLENGYSLPMSLFVDCVRTCAKREMPGPLVSIIEQCKKTDERKSLCPPWHVCNCIVHIAMQSDNCELMYYALEFMSKWIARGELAHLAADSGLLVSLTGPACRAYNSKLLDILLAVIDQLLHQQKILNPEVYTAKIYVQAKVGNLEQAFSTLYEFEMAVKHIELEEDGDMFSPFGSLNPLVLACTMNGRITIDAAYTQLEKLSRDNPHNKSVSAVNCIILAYANIWNPLRARLAFDAITDSFGLIPNIHSYNSLICAYGKLHRREEAVEVYNSLVGAGVKPNVTTFSLLADAHLISRDQKAALSVIDDMVQLGYKPSKEMLKKLRRRCIRELDYRSDVQIDELARKFNIPLCTEVRRDLLFHLHCDSDSSSTKYSLRKRK